MVEVGWNINLVSLLVFSSVGFVMEKLDSLTNLNCEKKLLGESAMILSLMHIIQI